MGGILALVLLGTGMNTLHPIVHKYIFDRLAEGGPWNAVLLGVGGLLALGLVGEVTSGVANWLTWRTRLRMNEELLEDTIGTLYGLPMEYHQEESVGGLMTRTERGINGFLSALTELAFAILPALVYVVIAGAIMVRLEWRLSLLVLAGAVIVAGLSAWAAGPQTRREQVLLHWWSGINGRFAQALSGILTVKSLALEDAERRRFLRRAHRANRMVLRGVRFDTGINGLRNTASILTRVAVVGFGAWLVLEGDITIGTLVAFIGYLAGIFGPIFGLTGSYAALRRASVALSAIFGILDAPARRARGGTRRLPTIRGEVSFDGVGFEYQPGRPVLRNVSFDVEPGEHVALVGPSGSGKTTLVALLQRFYTATRGAIRVDGQDIMELDEQWLRRNIGVVLQETMLFNDTVRNNLLAGRPGASMEEVRAAARASQADGFIERLADGYDTVIAEGGRNLSGGQRQRLGIARALLKDPPILILDEATSSLDADAQSTLAAVLPRAAEGRTTFIISHQLNMIRGADRILVLRDGTVVESGSHDELMEEDGTYARFHRLQTGSALRPGGRAAETALRDAPPN